MRLKLQVLRLHRGKSPRGDHQLWYLILPLYFRFILGNPVAPPMPRKLRTFLVWKISLTRIVVWWITYTMIHFAHAERGQAAGADGILTVFHALTSHSHDAFSGPYLFWVLLLITFGINDVDWVSQLQHLYYFVCSNDSLLTCRKEPPFSAENQRPSSYSSPSHTTANSSSAGWRSQSDEPNKVLSNKCA